MYYLSLYWGFVRIRWRTQSQFRGAFIMTAISKIAGFGAQFLTVFLLVNRFGSLGGWTADQVLSLFALNSIAYALGACFGFHTARAFDNMARDGSLDGILTKPVNPFLYILSNRFSSGYVGNLIVSITCLVIGLTRVGTPMTPFHIGMLALALVGGALIHGSAMILFSIPAMWNPQAELRSLFYNNFRNMSDYPINIYPAFFRVLMTWVLPYAFIAFYPAQAIFGIAPLYHPALQFVSPVVGLILCFLTYRLFWYGVKRYQGTGT